MKILESNIVWTSPDGIKNIVKLLDELGNEYKSWDTGFKTGTEWKEEDVVFEDKDNQRGEKEKWVRKAGVKKAWGGGMKADNPETRSSIEHQVALKEARPFAEFFINLKMEKEPFTITAKEASTILWTFFLECKAMLGGK